VIEYLNVSFMITLLSLGTLFLWVVMTLICVYNFWTADRLENCPIMIEQGHRGSLSILIPARNEEQNLRTILPPLFEAIRALQCQGIEVELLIFDDDSTDQTSEVVLQAFSSEKAFLNKMLIRSHELPTSGWTGKNAACHQLQKYARFEHFLFLDADVRLGPQALVRAWYAYQNHAADALSVLPHQTMESLAERLIIPLIMHFSIFTLLPLKLVLRSPYPSLSVLNGQFFLISKKAYHQVGGHAAVQTNVLEDVVLGRLLKRQGLRLHILTATRDISVRMYTSFATLWEGFGKNLAPLLGGNSSLLALFNALGVFYLLCSPLTLALSTLPSHEAGPLALLPRFFSLTPFFCLILCRFLIARVFRYRYLPVDIVLHPLAATSLLLLSTSSVVRRIRKTTTWKGRTV
jgi:chlorobactene glucosyltransferase